MLSQLFKLLDNINLTKVEFKDAISVRNGTSATMHILHIKKLSVGYSALVDLFHDRAPIRVENLPQQAIEMIVTRLRNEYPQLAV